MKNFTKYNNQHCPNYSIGQDGFYQEKKKLQLTSVFPVISKPFLHCTIGNADVSWKYKSSAWVYAGDSLSKQKKEEERKTKTTSRKFIIFLCWFTFKRLNQMLYCRWEVLIKLRTCLPRNSLLNGHFQQKRLTNSFEVRQRYNFVVEKLCQRRKQTLEWSRLAAEQEWNKLTISCIFK